MDNDNNNELNLSVQCTYVEEQLRVSHLAANHKMAIMTNQNRSERDVNSFHIGSNVCITNNYCIGEQGTEGNVILVSFCCVKLKNRKISTTYKRHRRNVVLVTAATDI